jgi:FkbH-like protein
MSNKIFMDLEWLPKPPVDFSSRSKALLDDAKGAGRELRSLAACALDQNQLIRLATSIEKLRANGADLEPLVPFRLGLLSNSTMDFIVPALVATAARYGLALEVITGGYDQVLQDALAPDARVNRSAPDAVLLAIDYRGIPIRGGGTNAEKGREDVRASLEYLQAVRDAIKRNSKAICVFQTVSAPPETLFGSMDAAFPGSLSRIIDGVNIGISDSIGGSTDIVIDLAHLASTVGLAYWHSPSQWNSAKIPFSDAFVPLYADHVCRALAAVRGKSRKCLILDLDNTLWGGAIGDDGLEGIQIGQGDPKGEAYLDVQQLALDLRARGIVLAVCSKNEDETARAPFRSHPEMLLKENHIAVFQANWNDKATNIKAIAQELSLGLDAMVFLDDNPAERLLIRQTLPEVAVPELPDDPALYSRTLAAAGYFEAVAFSEDDLRRADFYQDNARRVILQKQAGDLESYLASLAMEITFQPFDEIGRSRIAQLINKSNQFNLTTKRYTEAQIAAIQNDPAYFTLQVRLSDAFGDNGMIAAVICRRATKDEWEIETWLMSCRVLGRRVENMTLLALLDQAKKEGVRKLIGTYIPTDRNKLVEDHYTKLGFRLVKTQNQASTYELDVASAVVEGAPMSVRHLVPTQGPRLKRKILDIARHPANEAPIGTSMEAPQTHRMELPGEIESVLIRIWEDVLDRDNVGIRDDFFELGGDSLRGVRLMIEIENKFQRRFEISKLVSHPTIEALAQELGASVNDVEAAHIVPMRPLGDRTPLFCVHCGTGHVLRYRALASYLDSDIPIYGIRAPDLWATNTAPTVEDLAELYLADVRKIQPHGPYQFFGFCFGGTVAFEIARRLTEIGETVSFVVLVQTSNAAYYRKLSSVQSLRYGLSYISGRFSKYSRRFLRGEWSEIYTGFRSLMAWRKRKRQSGSLRDEPASAETSEPKDVYDNIAMLATIGDAFVPKPYSGRIHLIRAKEQPAESQNDMTFGWQDIARDGVEVITLPGNHYSLLELPQVIKVAETVDAWLAKKEVHV